MSHARQQIREAIVTALTGLNTTRNNIYASRIFPMENTSLPGIIVYTKSEISEPANINNPRRIERQLNVAVEIYAKVSANIDSEFDKIAAEVEKAIAENSILQSLIKEIHLSSTEITFTGEGEKIAGVATLTFTALYFTAENNPETFI